MSENNRHPVALSEQPSDHAQKQHRVAIASAVVSWLGLVVTIAISASLGVQLLACALSIATAIWMQKGGPKDWKRHREIRDRHLISICEPAEKLGITRIGTGGAVRQTSELEGATRIRFVAVTGHTFIKIHKTSIVALLKNGGKLEILVAKANSTFVSEVEASESLDIAGMFSQELMSLESTLRSYLKEAGVVSSESSGARIEIAYSNTLIRNTCIFFDEDTALYTPYLHPCKAVDSPTFALENRGGSCLFQLLNKQFDRAWNVAKSDDSVVAIVS
jgi:hypothetical protein